MGNLLHKGRSRFRKHGRFGLIGMVALNLLMVFLSGCKSNPPILIGFSGEFTNSRGEGGAFSRYGVELAVEELNRRNGILGRPILLVVKDDQNSPDVARQVDAELVEQGVAAIIGHMTSAQTAAVFAQNNQARIVFLSPVSASSDFSRQRDYFFRVVPANDLLSQALAQHVMHYRQIRRISGVYDLSNRTFAETFWQLFRQEFERLGGMVSQEFSFHAGETDLPQFAAQIRQTAPDALLIAASPVDTAFLAQYLAQQGARVPMFSSTWAQTGVLLEKGGQAVEGLEMVAVYHPQNPYPAFQPFVNRFKERFKRDPTFHAAYGYEAMLVLAHALERTHGQAAGLPEALLQIDNFPGIQGAIAFDEYGDVRRDVYIVQVHDGQFRVINTITPGDE